MSPSIKNNNTTTPWSRYRLGYVDGYNGKEKQRPNDEWYCKGYEEGEEADKLDQPMKYFISIDNNEFT